MVFSRLGKNDRNAAGVMMSAAARIRLRSSLQSFVAEKLKIALKCGNLGRFLGHASFCRPKKGVDLLARRPFKVVAIALGNKMARIAWALLASGGRYRTPRLAAA
jgi:hypothetical protein